MLYLWKTLELKGLTLMVTRKIANARTVFHSSFLQNQMETSYECMTTCKNPTCTDKRLVKSCLTLDYRISMT